jgi:hypothetical protein
MVVAAVYFRAEWFGPLNQVSALRWIAERLEAHGFFAAMLTLALICTTELAVCRLFGLGEPVIGLSLINGLIVALLVASYYTVFAATALFAQATGRTCIPRYAPGVSTYWLPREQTPVTLESMRKQ